MSLPKHEQQSISVAICWGAAGVDGGRGCVPEQVYLHLVDPTRDRHLMNKSDDVLVKTCGVRTSSSAYLPSAMN